MTISDNSQLSHNEKSFLLSLAHESIQAAVAVRSLPHVDLDTLSPRLRNPGACFVTLYRFGELRGCTGTLVARSPLAVEVIQTAAQTALFDPRFSPVSHGDIDGLEVEISILTPSETLEVTSPEKLPDMLHPGVDGVTLLKGVHKATFLPQVWEKIPDPVDFLDMLCQKMGLPRSEWRRPGMKVEIYHVEEFADHHIANDPSA